MLLRPGEAHSNRLIMIIGRLSNLRVDIHEKILTCNREIISVASSIEADLVAWLAALPPDFTYETHIKSPYDFMFQERCSGLTPYDDKYYEYPSLWVCNTWNQYRSARIMVSEIILSHIRKLSESSSIRLLSEEFRQHCKTIWDNTRRLAVDICRSVPYHLGVHLNDSSPNIPPPESYMGGLMLLWPLFLAGIVENPNHALRRWVIQCLRTIGHSYGFDQALAIMDIVAVDPGILREAEARAVAEEYASPEEIVRLEVLLPDLHYKQIPASGDTFI